jgi:hypothetical protein
MAEMFEGPKVIDAKTYETSLLVEKGMFRRRQIPAVVEARQLQPDKYAARKWAILGIISRISIGDVIQYDLTLQRGGNHKDLRPLQDNERICRARRWNINSRYDHERLELRQTQLRSLRLIR